MKIIEICPYDMARPGGVQTHVRDLSRWLGENGHEVLMLAPKSAPPYSEAGLRQIGVARSIGFQGSDFEISLARRREIFRLKHEIGDFGGELVHLHTPWTPLIAWQIWRNLGLPSVATFHATIPDQNRRSLGTWLLFRAAGYFMRRLDATVVPSSAPLSALRAHAGGRALTVIPPAINLTAWKEAGDSGRKSKTARVSILCLGRLDSRKGIATLLQAWTIIARSLPAATLTIAGSGKLEPEVIAAVRRAQGRITFVKQPDRATALQLAGAADIFAAPAEFGESFGLVLLEAMAAGAVPVAAANPGYLTVMTATGRDLSFPPGDHAAMAEKIITLANRPDLRATYRDWGRAHALTFDLDHIGPKFEALFRQVLQRRSATAKEGCFS